MSINFNYNIKSLTENILVMTFMDLDDKNQKEK